MRENHFILIVVLERVAPLMAHFSFKWLNLTSVPRGFSGIHR